MVDYVIQGKVTSKRNGLPVPYADIEILEVDPTAGANYKVDLIATGQSSLNGDFEIPFSFPYALPTRPDIIFRVSQKIDGIVKIIYNESPAEDTRWNIGDVLYVSIKVDEDCVTSNIPIGGPPYSTLFVFTRVGVIATMDIDQTEGYAYLDTNPAAPNSKHSNVPFGRTLDIAGWFGLFCDVEYYKVQYSKDGINWNDISDPLNNNWYNVAEGRWVTESMGPITLHGVNNLYRLPNRSIPWTFPDLLARWDSTKVQDGLYTFRVLGKKEMSGSIVDATFLTIDPSYGNLKLMTDNTPPKCNIIDVFHNTTKLNPCDIVDFTSGTIKVEFEASDHKGHLRLYRLNAYYGHNQVVVPTPTPPISPDKAVDDYSSHIDPTMKWSGAHALPGGKYTIEYPATEYNSVEMPSCAYQFRLRVDKRTDNGYGLVYWGYEDTVHITIQR